MKKSLSQAQCFKIKFFRPLLSLCVLIIVIIKDGKHSVFGRVVGGNDTLRELELHPTDKKTDRPIDDIKILSTEVFVDPYPDAEKALIEARKKV